MTRARCGWLLTSALLACGSPLAHADDAPLQQYVDEALHNNPALQARHASVRAAEADLDAMRAQRFPELAVAARYTRADGGRTIEIPTGALLNPVYDTLNGLLPGNGELPRFSPIRDQKFQLVREREQETKLSLTAPLLAPALWAQVDARDALAGASRAAREAYARALIRELKRAYYGAIQADAAVGILESSATLLTENLRVSQVLVDAGKATRERVLRADAEKLATEQQLEAARDRAAQARRFVNLLRGIAIDAPLTLPTPESLKPPAPLGIIGHDRPELRQLDASRVAAEAGARAARAQRWPTLGVAADYGIQGEDYRRDEDSEFSTISLLLRWTLWDSGKISAEAASASAQAAALRAEHADLQRRLRLARQAAEEDFATAQRAVMSSSARVIAAEEAFRIAERKRAVAALSQIEFLDAERTQREARLALAIARCEVLDRAAELEFAAASYPLPDDLRATP